MPTLEISIEGGDEARQMLSNIDRYLPSIAASKMRKTANGVYKDLLWNMDFSLSFPRGNLRSRTVLQHSGFLTYEISMPEYGKYVDSGTLPHRVSKPYLFKPWQKRAGIKSLSSAIFNKGTKGRNFITKTEERDLPRRMEEFKIEFISELRNKMKGGI